jgi:TP901 family phage tail tape measure protein
MTELSVGALFGTVELVTVSFDRSYARVVTKMEQLGVKAEQSSASTSTLDRGLARVGESATAAAVGVDRATKAVTSSAAAEQKAAVAAERHAKAEQQVAAVMNDVTATTDRERRAMLGLLAAEDRLVALQESGTASTRQLAAAQSGLVGATERVAAAQRAAASSAEVSAVSYGKASSGMGGLLKTAGELGLVIGAIEIAKKAIEFVGAGKELTTALNGVQAASRATDAQMKGVRAEAIGLGKDLRVPGATAVDAAQAIEDLVKAGVSLPRAMQAARPALLLAAAANVSTADSARVLGDVLDEFQLPASQATKVANALAAASNSAGGGLMDMFQAFTYVGPRARAVGLGVDDIAAAVTDLAKAGIQGDRAGTGLAMMLQKLSSISPKGQQALDDLGISAFDAQGRFKGLPNLISGLHAAMERMGPDSQRFLKDISDAFGARAANVVAAFAGKGVESYNLFLRVIKSGDVQKYADLQNRGVAASFRQLEKQGTAAGIDLYQSLEPRLTSVLDLISHGIPAAVAIGSDAFRPMAKVVGPVVDDLLHVVDAGGQLVGALGPVTPVLGAVAGAALAMFAAFKGYQIVRLAVNTVVDGYGLVRARAAGALVDVQRYGVGSGAAMRASAAEGEAAARIMQAEFDQIAASALTSAAAVSRSAATDAVAFADMTAASKASTDAQVADADARAGAALAAARSAAVSATIATGAAEESSAAIVVSGDAAKVGWAGIAGPLGLAAIGILSIVTMFHHSTTASKEATDAAKAYTDALSDGGKSDLFDTITKQLSDNKVPETLTKLNKALGGNAFTGKQFVTAISAGGSALKTLRSRLEDVIKTGTSMPEAGSQINMTPAAKAATEALKHLNTQYSTLSKAAAKELVDTKAFAGAAGAIQKTTTATKLGSDAAKQYAEMAGLQVSKNGIVAQSQSVVDAAVGRVADAYDHATQAGSDYLAALNTFSKSPGAAADRAALIGATLKAANGDALGFAASMNAGANATKQLDTDIAAAAKSVGKSGVSVHSFIKSIVDLKAGTIDYKNAAAAPLIADLQGMQTAAMNAASAMFQHDKSTRGAKAAADEAYTTFQSLTSGALVSQAKQLGLTSDQAKRLADHYFGMPKDVKTLIEQEGADPVLDVLNKIGAMLAKFTGQPWNATLDASGNALSVAKQIHDAINGIPTHKTIDITVNQSVGRTVHDAVNSIHSANGNIIDFYAKGGMREHHVAQIARAGTMRVWAEPETGGEAYIPLATSKRTRSRAIATETVARLGGVATFASGGITHSGKNWIFAGIKYESRRAAENARTRADAAAHKAGAAVVTDATALAGGIHSNVSINSRGQLVGAVKDASTIAAGLTKMDTALQNAGVPKRFIAGLSRANAAILAQVNRRNAAAATLATANKALADAKAKLAEDRTAFAGAVTGSFDVTSAGADANGKVTGGGMRAQQAQAISRARLWLKDIQALVAKKTFPASYIRDLAAKGPDALDQAQALLSMSSKDLSAFSANERVLSGLANAAGTAAAVRLDQPGVNAAAAAQSRARTAELAQQTKLNGLLRADIQSITREIRSLHLETKISASQLALLVQTGNNQNKSR